MAWLTENWFWLLIFIAFVAMHMFGHGGHHGHAGGERKKDQAKGRVVGTNSGGHHH